MGNGERRDYIAKAHAHFAQCTSAHDARVVGSSAVYFESVNAITDIVKYCSHCRIEELLTSDGEESESCSVSVSVSVSVHSY